MKELTPGIEDILFTFEKSIDPELKLIRDKDWSILEGPKLKKTHDLQKIWTTRNIDHASKLYKEAKKDGVLNNTKIKRILEKVTALVDIYESRYESFYSKRDWNKYLEDDSEEDSDKIEAEVNFQSQLHDNLMSFKRSVREFDLSTEKEKVEIPVFNHTPVPFPMRFSVEERFPQVKEHLERRKQNEK